MSGWDADGDDDDFQIPGRVSLSQNLILSSLKSSICQPSKPSNGNRSMKRPRPFSAIGKENAVMLKSPTPDSRDKGGAKSANSKMKKPYQNIFPVGLGKSDIALGCAEEVVIEDQNSTNTLNIMDSWPYREESFESSSRRLKSVESCLLKYGVNASSNFDEDFSSVLTYNDKIGTKLSSSCDLEKLVTMWEMESALECKGSNETVVKESSLALDELRLAGDSISRIIEIESLNKFVHRSTTEGQREISSHARLFELKENPVLSGKRDFSSGIDGCEESKGNKEENYPKAQENGSSEGTQFASSGNYRTDLLLVDNRKENLNAMSIEAKLLNTNGNVGLFTINSFVEKEEFESGSQLNVLMDLCCEMGEQGGSENGMSSSEQINLSTELITLENTLVIQCPLCQTDITKMSEKMRHIHTNECLDKYDTNEATVPIRQTKLNTFQQNVDTNPVLEWLSALDLCQYEEAFIKEEIDWDTLQWLTEEDLFSIGVVALGPRKKILHALKELRQSNCIGQGRGSDSSISALNESKKFGLPGNKLITEYFHGSVSYKARGDNVFKYFDNIESANKGLAQKRVGIQRSIKRRTIREIPLWCCIPGTPFRVDAFRYLRGDCCHWFLTHFHMDHYQGLTKNFCHGKVYCSEITARLVHTKIGVPWERIQILPLNQKITIGGVNLTCLDANHCPGSIIILFEPSNNKAVLHTGDFRFSAEMVSSSVLQSSCIHTLILDTTYCNPQYDFPKQEEVIQFVIDAIQAEAFNPKTLFLIGTYTIGKERLFLEVARTLKRKVYAGAAKLHLLECLGLPEEDIQLFTSNEMESCIHIVPMWTIASFKRMKHIYNRYSEQYNLVVAFSPTGWTFGKGKKKTPGRRLQQGTIIRYEVPYSEHCSFTELKEFVRFIAPENIIPSVNNEGPASVEAMLALLSSPDS